MSYHLRIRNFRSIHSLDWSVEGVSLLAGPNGAGKTTVLRSFQFLRNALLRGITEAVKGSGGAKGLRRLNCPGESVRFELEIENVVWSIEVAIEGDGFHHLIGEKLTHAGETLLDVPIFQESFELGGVKRGRSERPEIHTLASLSPQPWLDDFIGKVRDIRCYEIRDPRDLLRANPGDEADQYLHPGGSNLIPVLRNWRSGARKTREQVAWIEKNLRMAFPGLFEDLELLPEGSFFRLPSEGPEDRLPLHLAADGLLIGLAHLAAVAGAKPGSLVAIDEVENHLHPHAIRTILRAMRELAAERNLTLILTSHSPVLWNTFRRFPEQVYDLTSGEPNFPRSLVDLHDEVWLAQVPLGDLYDRLEVAAPTLPSDGRGSEF